MWFVIFSNIHGLKFKYLESRWSLLRTARCRLQILTSEGGLYIELGTIVEYLLLNYCKQICQQFSKNLEFYENSLVPNSPPYTK